MSTLATNPSLSSFSPVIFRGKRTAVLEHIAQSERLAAVRPASRLEVRPKPEMISTGILELDVLMGGIPRGCLTEICGTPSSGKTSMLLAALAAATQRGESCVLIDASDSFDPTTGTAAGLDFNKLLWIRCGAPPLWASVVKKNTNHREHTVAQRKRTGEHKLEQVLKSTDLILQSGGFGLVALDIAGIPDKFVRRIPLASWFRFQRAVEHSKTALLVISEFPYAQTCAAMVMKLSAISCQPSAKSTVRNSGTESKLDLIHAAGPIHGSSRKTAACESPAWKRRVDEGADIESRKGRRQFCKIDPSVTNIQKLTHAEMFLGMQIEAGILRSRLERKPVQSARTAFSTQAVRAG